MNHASFQLRLVLILVIISLWTGACAPSADQPRQATVDALANRVSLTLTAAADPNRAAAVDTSVPGPTLGSRLQALTQTNDETGLPESTRIAIRPILAELPLYKVDTDKGEVAWIQSSLNIEAEGFNSIKVDNQHPEIVVNDFVLSADITWNTRYGDSGCGFIFRSNGDQLKPSQYMIIVTRLGSGHIGFTVLSNGEIANVHDIYPKTNDPRFNAENASTNQLTIVARGTQFQIYTNRSFVGEFDPDKPPDQIILPTPPVAPLDPSSQPQLMATYTALKAVQQQEIKNLQAQRSKQVKVFNEANKDFSRGFVTMVAATQSGKVSCAFKNVWLWLIKE